MSRFSRRGLAAVRREFALHALAYNLGRAVALLQAIYMLLLAWSLWIRRAQRARMFCDSLWRTWLSAQLGNTAPGSTYLHRGGETPAP